MRRQVSPKRELLIAVVATTGAAAGALDLIGHPARTVHVLTIFAGGLAAGVSLGRAIDRLRAARREAAAAEATAATPSPRT